jgi:hypothetical protein
MLTVSVKQNTVTYAKRRRATKIVLIAFRRSKSLTNNETALYCVYLNR